MTRYVHRLTGAIGAHNKNIGAEVQIILRVGNVLAVWGPAPMNVGIPTFHQNFLVAGAQVSDHQIAQAAAKCQASAIGGRRRIAVIVGRLHQRLNVKVYSVVPAAWVIIRTGLVSGFLIQLGLRYGFGLHGSVWLSAWLKRRGLGFRLRLDRAIRQAGIDRTKRIFWLFASTVRVNAGLALLIRFNQGQLGIGRRVQRQLCTRRGGPSVSTRTNLITGKRDFGLINRSEEHTSELQS